MIDHSKVQATLRFCGVLFFLSSPVLALGPSNLASGPASQRGETAPVFSPLVIQNPGVVEISPEGFDRVLAISDIH